MSYSFRAFCCLLLSFVALNQLHAAPPAYAQLSSLVTQLPSPTGDRVIKMESLDAVKNMDVSADKTSVLVKVDGVYLIIAAVQLGASNPGVKGWMDVWLKLNDKDMPNSNTRYYISNSSETVVLVVQSVSPFKAGDRISVGFSASGPSLGAIFTQPANEPAIPSIITSILKIGDLE